VLAINNSCCDPVTIAFQVCGPRQDENSIHAGRLLNNNPSWPKIRDKPQHMCKKGLVGFLLLPSRRSAGFAADWPSADEVDSLALGWVVGCDVVSIDDVPFPFRDKSRILQAAPKPAKSVKERAVRHSTFSASRKITRAKILRLKATVSCVVQSRSSAAHSAHAASCFSFSSIGPSSVALGLLNLSSPALLSFQGSGPVDTQFLAQIRRIKDSVAFQILLRKWQIVSVGVTNI
jgi:hypothetical protein